MWIGRRFGVPTDEITASTLIASIVSAVALTRKLKTEDKITWNLTDIELMEAAVLNETLSLPARLYIGMILLMTMASLRFDDALHSPPDLMSLRPGALYGVSWQTKVERKRKGTRFACTRGTVGDKEWVRVWYELLVSTLPPRVNGRLGTRDYLLDVVDSTGTGFERGIPAT